MKILDFELQWEKPEVLGWMSGQQVGAEGGVHSVLG